LSKHAGFNLEYGELKVLQDSGAELTVANIREKVVEVRRAKLPEPEIIPNAGSFFKNPIVSNSELSALKSRFPGLVSYDLGNDQAKLAAGWLIDNAGWKGKCSEKVGVHAKQALVLVNLGGASLEDVLTFAGEIQESILSKYSVRLEIEPNIIY
jgi:UDP-N-acetylmuramate dehydrogenase